MPGAIESSLGFATELKTASLANHRVRLFLWYPFDPLLPYGGNKVFKLQPNLALARQAGYQRVATFGGAFSNHLLALAHAASGSGLQLVCFVRGDPQLTPSATLRDLVDLGAQLQFLSRQDYRLRQNPQFLNSLKEQFPECYWIPEGGSNLAGVRGCAQMGRLISQWATSHIDGPYRVVLPAATGAPWPGSEPDWKKEPQ